MLQETTKSLPGASTSKQPIGEPVAGLDRSRLPVVEIAAPASIVTMTNAPRSTGSSSATSKSTRKSARRCIGLALLVAVFVIAGSLVTALPTDSESGCAADEVGSERPRAELIRSHTAFQEAPIWLHTLIGFLHPFGTLLYLIAAPIDLFLHARHHRAHGRRIPRICLCLSVATAGGVLCLIGWLLTHWTFTLGLTVVGLAHLTSATIERGRHWIYRV